MTGEKIKFTLFNAGPITSPVYGTWKLEDAISIIGVSASSSVPLADEGKIDVGLTSGSEIELFDGGDIGTLNSPTLYGTSDWNGDGATVGEPYRVAKDEVIRIGIQQNNNGNPLNDVAIVITALEG